MAYSARGWGRGGGRCLLCQSEFTTALKGHQPQSLSGQRSWVRSGKRGVQKYESIPLLASAETRCTQNALLIRDSTEGSQTLADGEAENSVTGTGLGWDSYTLVFSSSLALPPCSICANEGQACASNQTASQTAPVFFPFGTKHWVSWEQTRVPPGCPFPLPCTYFGMMFRSVGSSCWNQGSNPATVPSSSSGKAVSYR